MQGQKWDPSIVQFLFSLSVLFCTCAVQYLPCYILFSAVSRSKQVDGKVYLGIVQLEFVTAAACCTS